MTLFLDFTVIICFAVTTFVTQIIKQIRETVKDWFAAGNIRDDKVHVNFTKNFSNVNKSCFTVDILRNWINVFTAYLKSFM